MHSLGKVRFIRSQKKNPQLVYEGYIYNKKLTQVSGHTTWRCTDVKKNKCKAVCITKNSELVSVRRQHIHEPHWSRISNRALYAVENDLDEYFEISSGDITDDKIQQYLASGMIVQMEDSFVKCDLKKE